MYVPFAVCSPTRCPAALSLTHTACQHAGTRFFNADADLFAHAATVSDKASPTKGIRIYDALKATRWHPDFRLQNVSIAAVRLSLAAARCSPLWAAGGKKAPSTAAIASMINRFTMCCTELRALRTMGTVIQRQYFINSVLSDCVPSQPDAVIWSAICWRI